MQVEETSAGQLMLQESSWGLALLLGALSPMLGLLLLGGASLTTLTCSRQTATCEFIHQSHPFAAAEERTLPIESVQAAQLDRITGSGSNPSTYRVSLAIQERDGVIRIPLQAYSRNAAPKERRVAEINRFLTDSQLQTLAIVQDERWMQYVFSASALILGVGLALSFASRTTYTFDRLLGALTLQTKGLVYNKTQTFRLGKQTKVLLTAVKSGKKSMSTAYRVDLELEGDPHSLSISTSQDRGSQRQLAERIHHFLQLAGSVTDLDQTQEDTPLQGLAMLKLAMAGESGREKNIQEYRNTLHRDPTDMATHQKLVIALMMQKRGKEARAHLLKTREQLEAQGLTRQVSEADQLLELLDSMQGKSLEEMWKNRSEN